MSHKDFTRKQIEFQDDLVARQRNVVFPDTFRNSGLFYRELIQGNRALNATQRAGVLILGAFFILCGTIPFMSAVDGWRSASQHKLLNGYRGFFAPGLFTLLSVLFVLLGAKLIGLAIVSPKSLKKQGFLRRKAWRQGS